MKSRTDPNFFLVIPSNLASVPICVVQNHLSFKPQDEGTGQRPACLLSLRTNKEVVCIYALSPLITTLSHGHIWHQRRLENLTPLSWAVLSLAKKLWFLLLWEIREHWEHWKTTNSLYHTQLQSRIAQGFPLLWSHNYCCNYLLLHNKLCQNLVA